MQPWVGQSDGAVPRKTGDARMIAIELRTTGSCFGRAYWVARLGRSRDGVSTTRLGGMGCVHGDQRPARGARACMAYGAADGREFWRLYTIPGATSWARTPGNGPSGPRQVARVWGLVTLDTSRRRFVCPASAIQWPDIDRLRHPGTNMFHPTRSWHRCPYRGVF